MDAAMVRTLEIEYFVANISRIVTFLLQTFKLSNNLFLHIMWLTKACD